MALTVPGGALCPASLPPLVPGNQDLLFDKKLRLQGSKYKSSEGHWKCWREGNTVATISTWTACPSYWGHSTIDWLWVLGTKCQNRVSEHQGTERARGLPRPPSRPESRLDSQSSASMTTPQDKGWESWGEGEDE